MELHNDSRFSDKHVRKILRQIQKKSCIFSEALNGNISIHINDKYVNTFIQATWNNPGFVTFGFTAYKPNSQMQLIFQTKTQCIIGLQATWMYSKKQLIETLQHELAHAYLYKEGVKNTNVHELFARKAEIM